MMPLNSWRFAADVRPKFHLRGSVTLGLVEGLLRNHLGRVVFKVLGGLSGIVFGFPSGFLGGNLCLLIKGRFSLYLQIAVQHGIPSTSGKR